MYNIPINKIPPKGFILAFFPNSILFDAYEVHDNKVVFCNGLGEYADNEMTECHFFSRDAEFRAIFSQGRNQWIETTLHRQQEELMDRDLIYTQTVLVKKKFTSSEYLPKQLIIVNRYEYSANDTLVLKNYRISY